MTAESLVKLLQMTGAALAIPAAAAGTFAAYQSYFSSDVVCQKLRTNIVAILERHVAPETKRSLLKKDVAEFDKLCGEGDPDARAIFQAAVTEHPGDAAHAPAAAGAAHADASPSASRPPRSAFLVLGLQGALRLGRAQSPAVRFLGAAFQRLRDLRYVIAAARHHIVRENDAAGLVGTAGRQQRSDQAAEPAAYGCLRARARNSRRERAVVGRGRPGIMLVS